jgi:hypothetical protein
VDQKRFRPNLERSRTSGENVHETHSIGMIFSLTIWNKENCAKHSKGMAIALLLLEE